MIDQSFRLPDPVMARAKASPIKLVRDLALILQDAAGLANALDRGFQHRQMSTEVFTARVSQLRRFGEINRLYWCDTASTIKAYTLSSTWRILELVRQTYILLDNQGVLGPAILARSLIELATVFVQTGGAVREAVSGAARAWDNKIILCEDLCSSGKRA